MKKTAVAALAAGITLMLPEAVVADEKQLEKRLEALEAKMAHMSAIEAENKDLKARLQKTEAKLEMVTAQKVVTVAPVRTVRHEVSLSNVAVPASAGVITKTAPATEKNWSGVYAGINAGYGTGEVSSQNNTVSFQSLVFPQYIEQFNSSTFDGPVVGGQIGYNYEFANKLIIGAETDLDYADINKWADRNYYNSTILLSSPLIQSSNQNSRNGIDWLGTARLRLGYDLGNFMPYITGGFAYGGVTSNSLTSQLSTSRTTDSNSYISSANNGTINSGSNSSIQVGWVAGAGAELKVAENWSIRGEYLFTQLGGLATQSEGANFSGYQLTNFPIPISNFNVTTNLNQSFIGPFGIHQARVGLNYHTNWLKELSVNSVGR